MGYEIKLIIGKECHADHGRYFQIMAEINMCKVGADSHILETDYENKTGTPLVYWYGYNGDTEINKDRYDMMPKPVPITEMHEAVFYDIQNDDYRRFQWAHALLSSMKDDTEGLSVLVYGY